VIPEFYELNERYETLENIASLLQKLIATEDQLEQWTEKSKNLHLS